MENAGLVEMALVFSVAVGIGAWELYALRRDKRRAAAREAERRSA